MYCGNGQQQTQILCCYASKTYRRDVTKQNAASAIQMSVGLTLVCIENFLLKLVRQRIEFWLSIIPDLYDRLDAVGGCSSFESNGINRLTAHRCFV